MPDTADRTEPAPLASNATATPAPKATARAASPPPAPSAPLLQQRYLVTLAAIAAVYLLVVLAYGWSSLQRQRAHQWWTLSTQAEQLQSALNERMDVARSHVAALRSSTERSLRQPTLADSGLAERLERRNLAPLRDAPWERLPQELTREVGALHLGPALDGATFRRHLGGLVAALPVATAGHAQHPELSWSYFLDAQTQWRWVYPAQARDDLLLATGTPEMGAALQRTANTQGTQPLERAGPQANPQKQLVWSPPHLDTMGKTTVISALAPVYDGESYVGVVGADVQVAALQQVLVQRPLPMGQAWVVDRQGGLVASATDSVTAGPSAETSYDRASGWLRLALRDTDWSLLVHAPAAAQNGKAWEALLPVGVIGALGLLALIGGGLLLKQQFLQPALQLADYVEQADGMTIKRPPPVAAIWKPWFDRVGHSAVQRRDRLLALHQTSSQLEAQLLQSATLARSTAAEHETQLTARAAELRSTYAQLSAAMAEAQAARKPPA
ncbi:MAG: cache domain-containing protein [Rhodoferax sp.]|nr:cache domain-containing protein [Rhodoferax sp.]